MKTLFLLVFSLLFATLFAHDSQHWRFSQAPAFRSINSVHIIDVNTIVITGGNETNDEIMYIARSINRGNTWDIIKDAVNIPWIKSVDFTSPSTGYAAGYKGLIVKTSDGGLTWNNLTAPGSVALRNFNCIHFINPQTGFIAGGSASPSGMQTILKTTDGGNTWIVKRDTAGNWLKSIFFTGMQTGYAAGDGGVVLKTTDGGDTWNPLSLTGNAASRNFNSVYFIDGATGFLGGGNKTLDSIQTILKTTDAGNSWSVIKDNIAPWITSIHFPTSTTGFATGDYGTMLVTDDAGDTWNPIAFPPNVNDSVRGLHTVFFLNADYGIAGGRGGKILIYDSPVATAPTVETVFATEIDFTSAVLNGRVNANGNSASVYFEYGLTPALGMSVAATPASVSGNVFSDVSCELPGLSANTLYYFRTRAMNSNGNAYGLTKQFYTGANPIPNFDFEEWDTIVKHVPEEWISIGSVIKTVSYDGSHAVRLQGGGGGDFGAILFGLPDDNDISGGIPFPARPDSLIGYFNYDIAPGDSALILLMLKNNGVINSQHFYHITGNSNGNFQRLSFPVFYSNNDIPDSIIIIIVSSDPLLGIPDSNSVMEVDNLSFAGTGINVLNYNFESWFDRELEYPLTWKTSDDGEANIFAITASKTTDSQNGNYAIKLQNYLEDGRELAKLFLGRGGKPGFPVSARYSELNGYFKYFPENSDSLRIFASLYKNGQTVSNGYFYSGATVNEYTPFTIPFQYFGFEDIPDSASIEILAGFDNPMRGNSILFIDNLGFDGFYIYHPPLPVNVISQNPNTLQWNIYPNPAQGRVVISGSCETNESLIFSISDLSGRILHHQKMQLPAGGFETSFDLKNVKNGLYVITLQRRGAVQFRKLVVVK